MIALRFESHLDADAAVVWRQVASMAGVNYELMPLVRMSHPSERQYLEAGDASGQVLFRSWLLLFGVLPFDRHALRIVRLYAGAGFDEDSTSWLQARWVHRRRVRARDGGVAVTDELEVEPRLRFAAPLVRVVVAALFRHRHRRLRARFGSAAG